MGVLDVLNYILGTTFASFYSTELKFCRLVDVCIANNRMFLTSKEFGLIETNVKKFWVKLSSFGRYGILKCAYVSKNSDKIEGNSKSLIKAYQLFK